MQTARTSILNAATVSKKFIRSAVISNVITNEGTQLKSWREIPGPSSLPIIGQFHHFIPGGDLYDASRSIVAVLHEKYGPIVRMDGFLGLRPTIFTSDPEIASHILRSENWLPIRKSFDSLDYFRKVLNKNTDNPDAPTGLISDHGEIWKKFRSTVNPIMLQPKTIKLYNTSLREVAEDMINRMRLIRDENNMLKGNFNIEMNLWALESIGVVALGGRLNCLDPNLPDDSPAKKLIKVVHDIFEIASELDLKPNFWRYISTPTYKKAMQIYEEQVKLSRYFIRKAIDQFNTKEKTSNEEKGVLEKLLEIDEHVAVIMASDMLFGGVDTTANTVTATLYLLANNPEKQDKLYAELSSQQDKTKYLKACLKESIRMMPVVSGNMRETTKEYNIMGYKIPKNMQIAFAHQILSMKEEHFPRATEYIPERWIADKNDPLYYGNTHPFTYSPFGFGARSCIGRRIAELELETFIATIIENFRVEWFGPPLKFKYLALNYTIGPYNFVFKDRK